MRECFKRDEVGHLVIPKQTEEIIQSIADECVDKLLTQLPDVDFADLQRRFEDVFMFRYTVATLRVAAKIEKTII